MTVSDTGIGIPAEKKQAIFEAFTQADSATTRNFGGTGLGLTISAQLVRLMHGRIWVESEPDKGSEFHFTARFGISADQPGEPAPRRLVGLRVLVVDDNETSRQILGETLASWGIVATLASGGSEALEALEAPPHTTGGKFQLLIIDRSMPGMDGEEVARHIKSKSAGRAPAMLLLSPPAA